MSRQRDPEYRDSGWRALALAAAAAAGVLLLLAVSVGAVWFIGSGSLSAPALGVQPRQTPTPRSLSFLHETPAAEGVALPSVIEAQAPGAQPDNPVSVGIAITPNAIAMTGDDARGTLPNGAVFSAPGDNAFNSLATDSWLATADLLRNDGRSADAEPLLVIAAVPGASFAMEAEIRVNAVLDAFCDQSFGLAGGDPAAARFYGGGVLFPCQGATVQARLTDVSDWTDGYHADPLLDERAFEPGRDWRTYRFELRGDTARLIVDGVGIVSGPLEPPIDASTGTVAAIWSQGVALEVRRLEIFPLPGE